MKIKDILFNANVKCDDNIDAHTQTIYFNSGINTINMSCGLKLPLINLQSNGEDEYLISEDEYVNNLIGNLLSCYIAYHTKLSEGYLNHENPFFNEFTSLKMYFINNFRQHINEDYRFTPQDNVNIKTDDKKHPKLFKSMRLW